MISAAPKSVKHQFALTSTPPLLSGQRSLLLDIPRGTLIQQAEITQLLQASIGSPKHSVRSASGWTTPTHAALGVPFLTPGLPTQCLIKLQFRYRLCIRMRTRISHQPIVSCFSCQVCRLVKLNFGDCLYCFWSNQLLCIHLHRW